MKLARVNFKIQGFAGAFWSGFDTFELRVQLTSAHTRTNCACESQSREARGMGTGLKKSGRLY